MPARATALDTRRKLLDAGRKVFAAKGLGGASLREDILTRAGISSGSFYHQFDDKADLLVAILKHDGQGVIKALENGEAERAKLDPVARGRAHLQNLFDMTDRHPEFVKIFVREYHSDSVRVRRQIRAHTERTIKQTQQYYDGLAEALDLPLDTAGIATLMTIECFSLCNYYLDFPKKKRQAIRDWLVEGMLGLATGGVLAVRLPRQDR